MGALAAPIAGGAASALVGGLMSKKSGGGGAGYQPVGPQFGDVLPHAMPWGVNVMGLGGTMVDETGRVVGTYMDPRLQAIANSLYQRAGEQTGAISGTMPQEIGTQYYEQFLAPQLAKSREQQELGLEKRLLAQGMLGSTGGALRAEALGTAQESSQRAARAAALGQAQSNLDLMRQRQMADIQAGTGLMTDIYGRGAGALTSGLGLGANIMSQAGANLGLGQGLFGDISGFGTSQLGQATNLMNIPTQYANIGAQQAATLANAGNVFASPSYMQGAQYYGASQMNPWIAGLSNPGVQDLIGQGASAVGNWLFS